MRCEWRRIGILATMGSHIPRQQHTPHSIHPQQVTNSIIPHISKILPATNKSSFTICEHPRIDSQSHTPTTSAAGRVRHLWGNPRIACAWQKASTMASRRSDAQLIDHSTAFTLDVGGGYDNNNNNDNEQYSPTTLSTHISNDIGDSIVRQLQQ